MKLLTVTIEGTQPLLMHNEILANPLSEPSKKLKVLTKKGKGVQRDNEKIAQTEFAGGLYHDDETGPYLPGWNVGACLKEAAKDERNGKNFSSFVRIVDDKVPLQYKGPRDVHGLWNAGFYDMRMVRNQAAKVLRTRPKFDKWSAEFTIEYDEKRLDEETILRTVSKAGSIARLGDYRARYGRFKLVSPQLPD